MALFPILLPFLGSIVCLGLIGPRFGAISRVSDLPFSSQSVRNPIVKAFFLFVPFYLIRLAFLRYLDIDYSPGGLYLYYLLFDYVGVFYVITAAAFFLNRSLKDREPLEQYVGYLSFFVVILVLTASMDALLNDGYWTLYELFIRPLVFLSFLVLIPPAVIRADGATGGGWAVLFVVAAPFFGALPAMFAEWMRPDLSITAAMLVFLLTGAGIYWMVFRGSVTSVR